MKCRTKESKHSIVVDINGSLSREILTAFLKRFRRKLSYYSVFAALPAILSPLAQTGQAEDEKKTEASVAGGATGLVEKQNKSRSKPNFLRSRSGYLLPGQKSKYSGIISELTGADNCPGSPIPGGTYTAAAPFIGSGNTTGANNTVESICSSYCYGYYDVGGPDQIYTFTLTGRGTDSRIQVTGTSANYNPTIYILEGCPGGTGNTAYNIYWLGFPGSSQVVLREAPLNVPLYLFVDSVGANNSGSYTIRMQDVTIAPVTAPPRTKFDFDSDGKADISVFRPSDGSWHINRSLHGFFGTQFGLSTDKITPADFDGDGRTDIAVFRDGVWYWLNSSNGNFNAIHFGLAGDIPVPADFTGDEQAELAVYRNGVWYTLDLQNNQFSTVKFGLSTDKPVVGDYDGDARADFAVYRDGIWYLLRSQLGFAAIQFGLSTDKLVPADYDGDGKTDIAVYRDGVWYLLRSNQGFTAVQFGLASDTPAPADFDGDGKADLAVYRDGNWYLLRSTNGFEAMQFGLTNDKPIPSAFLP